MLKCFEVQTQGVFHVEIYEVLDDEAIGYTIILELPDTVISQSKIKRNWHEILCIDLSIPVHRSSTVISHDSTSAVTGFSAVLGITIFGVILAVCILFILLVKRKFHKTSYTPTNKGSCAGSAVCIIVIQKTVLPYSAYISRV